MAVPRLLSRGRCLFPRTTPSVHVVPSAIPWTRTLLLKREFTASQYRREDIIETPSRGPEIALTDTRATTTSSSPGVAFLRISKRLSRREMEELIRSKGFTIKRIQMRVDRFNFQNDTMCFLEVGSEAEATKVMEEFSGLEIHGRKMLAQPLKSDFIWGKLERPKESPWPSRYFYDEGTAAFDAARPLLERRRMMLSVQTPGWSPGARIAIGKQQAAQIIERYFGKYGIERISDFSPFYGDLKSKPRMLCFIDFTTKEGAENAVNDLNNTEIEGRLTWLKPSDPAAWRHDQIGKVAPELLKELQESGVVSKDEQTSEDKFVNPLPKQ